MFVSHSILIATLVLLADSSDDILTLNDRPCLSNEYFDPKSFNCTVCDRWRSLTPSDDNLTCVCDDRSINIGWNKDGYPLCKKCKENEIPTEDSKYCIPCHKSNISGHMTCSACKDGSIQVERTQNGTLLRELSCMPCTPGTVPDKDIRKCVSCSTSLPNCNCSIDSHEFIKGLGCIPKNIVSSWPKSSEMYDILYNNEHVTSIFFQENLIRVLFKCKMNDIISCQYLSNMCVLNLYQDTNIGGPCSAFKESRRFNDVGLPKVFYSEGDAPSILHKKTISKRFTLDSSSEVDYTIYPYI